MSLFTPLTELQSDLLEKDELVVQTAFTAHALASQLKEANQVFWSKPTPRLLAVLNADVPATLATFQHNTELATVLNSAIDDVVAGRPELANRLAHRAPTTMGRTDIIFNPATGQFEVVVEP